MPFRAIGPAEHRIVYKVTDEGIFIAQLCYHY